MAPARPGPGHSSSAASLNSPLTMLSPGTEYELQVSVDRGFFAARHPI